MAVVELTKANFKETIENNEIVIVDFWAPWCEPCLTFSETFKKVAENHPDIVFGMVNTETDNEIAEYFNVEKIPGILVVREQAGLLAQVGALGEQALEEIVKWTRERDMSAVREYYASQQQAG